MSLKKRIKKLEGIIKKNNREENIFFSNNFENIKKTDYYLRHKEFFDEMIKKAEQIDDNG
jgi:hypothetical protein